MDLHIAISILRGFIFLPPKPSYNDSTKREVIFESRRQKIIEVCKKYKMDTGKPSLGIFNSILCFSEYEVSEYVSSKRTLLWSNVSYTANVFPIKSVGNPHVIHSKNYLIKSFSNSLSTV